MSMELGHLEIREESPLASIDMHHLSAPGAAPFCGAKERPATCGVYQGEAICPTCGKPTCPSCAVLAALYIELQRTS